MSKNNNSSVKNENGSYSTEYIGNPSNNRGGISRYLQIDTFRKNKGLSYREAYEQIIILLKKDLEKADNTNNYRKILNFYIGKCYVKLRNYDKKKEQEAVTIFTDLIEGIEKSSNPTEEDKEFSYYLYLELGKLFELMGSSDQKIINQENIDKAIKTFRKCLEIKPYYPFALIGLGDIAKKQGKVDLALYYLKSCRENNPDYKEVYFQIAQIYIYHKKGKDSEIEQALRAYLKDNNNVKPYSYYQLGICLRKQGKSSEALEFLNQYIQERNDNIYAYYEIILAYKDIITRNRELYSENQLKEKVTSAKKVFADFKGIISNLKSAEIKPKLKEKVIYACSEIGKTYRLIGELQNALDYFELALKYIDNEKNDSINEKFAFIYFEVAKLYRIMGELDYALEYVEKYKKAYIVQDNPGYVHLEFGKIYFQNSKINEAIEEFEASTKANEKPMIFGYLELGKIYITQGNYVKAEEMFRTFIKESKLNYKNLPENNRNQSLGNFQLGLLRLIESKNENKSDEKIDEAIFFFGKSIELSDIPNPHLYLAEIYYDKSEIDEAKNQIYQYFKKGGIKPSAYLEKGLIESRDNKDKDANSLYHSLIGATKKNDNLSDQIMNQSKINDKNRRVFNRETIKETLRTVANSINSGEYQYYKGYGCDFYCVKVNNCGYCDNTDRDNDPLNYVLVCTIPDSKNIIAMIPISGINELGKQADNIQYTTENVRGVINNDTRNISDETFIIRREIAKIIEGSINQINNMK